MHALGGFREEFLSEGSIVLLSMNLLRHLYNVYDFFFNFP